MSTRPNIGLVYIAAFGLDQGESLGALLSHGPTPPALPSWYLVATQDQTIPPDAERQFAARMGATTIEVPSSHVAMSPTRRKSPGSSRPRPGLTRRQRNQRPLRNR